MNIGNLKAREEDGTPIGKIATLNFAAVIALRAVQSNNDRAPAFDVMALSSDRRTWLKMGALWEFNSTATGESFYSGRIDDPSMARPLDIAAFRQDDGSYNVAWRRPKQRVDTPKPGPASGEDDLPALPPAGTDESTPATGEGTPADAAAGCDGLGESTAPAPRGRKARETADA